jgi:CO dehydrogenase/acetyl-CoA synthase delta subunit
VFDIEDHVFYRFHDSSVNPSSISHSIFDVPRKLIVIEIAEEEHDYLMTVS